MSLHLVSEPVSSVEASTGRKAFTIAEVAALIGLPYQRVGRLVTEGRIKSITVDDLRLIPSHRLDEFLAGE